MAMQYETFMCLSRDSGAIALAEALRDNPCLRNLDLNNNGLTDDSAESLLSCKTETSELQSCTINVSSQFY